jgi:hypothetical protein
MGTEVTTQEILRQAEQSGVSRIVVFPFPSTALADEEINERILHEAKKIKKFIPYYYIPESMNPIPDRKRFYGGKWQDICFVEMAKYGVFIVHAPKRDDLFS